MNLLDSDFPDCLAAEESVTESVGPLTWLSEFRAKLRAI